MSYNKNHNGLPIRYGAKGSEFARPRRPLLVTVALIILSSVVVFVFIIVISSMLNQNFGNSSTMECTIISKTAVEEFPIIDTTCGTFTVNDYGQWSRAITGNTYTLEVSDGVPHQIPMVHSIK